MSLLDIAALYLLIGVACAVAIYKAAPAGGAGALAQAALAVPLWPLWAPVALTSRRDQAAAPGLGGELADRVEASLREGAEACAGTNLEALLSRETARRLADEVAKIARRQEELEELLVRDGFDLGAAERRVAELEGRPGTDRTLATARLHLDNARRLHALRDRDRQALEELSELCAALRTQLVLARFAGALPEGVGGILAEVWARVEGLGAAMDDVSGERT